MFFFFVPLHPTTVSQHCTQPIQLAGVIGLAGGVIICNLNTVTGPHIILLCSHFPPHCLGSPAPATLLLTSLQHSSSVFLGEGGGGGGGVRQGERCEENKLGSGCRLIREGKGCRRFGGVEGQERSGRRREVLVSQRLWESLRDHVALAGEKFTSLTVRM